MKCRKCGGRIQPEYNRIRCLACGWSRWDNFVERVPSNKERELRNGDTTRWRNKKITEGAA